MEIRRTDSRYSAHLWVAIFFVVLLLTGCGGNNGDSDNTVEQPTSITFQLEFEKLSDFKYKTPKNRAIGKPDVCTDYLIDTIAIQLFRVSDDAEVAGAQESCTKHSLSVNHIPAGEKLYVVCKGQVGPLTRWQGRMDDIVATAGQTTDIGNIAMKYIGDDTVPPEVTTTYPAEDSVDIDLQASIAVVFNEALAPGSISEQAITVSGNDNVLPGSVRYEQGMHAIVFSPADGTAFDAQTTYTATLHVQDDAIGHITDTAGNRLPADITWQFGTRGAEDKVAPLVIATSPVDSATGVSQQTIVSAMFSEPMDPNSLIGEAFHLSTDHGAVSAQFAYDDLTRTLTMTPVGDLAAISLHTAVVTTYAKDVAQNALAAPHSWQFTTTGPLQVLTISKTGSGLGRVVSTPPFIDCGDTCQVELNAGTLLTLTATAEDSSEFTGWTGGPCDDKTGPCEVTITEDTTIAANFILPTYTITASLTCEDGDGGTISPASATVIHGDDATIDIHVNPYFYLSGISVDDTSISPRRSYRFENVTANHTIHAYIESKAENISNFPAGRDSAHQINADGHVVWNEAVDQNGQLREILYYNGNEIENISKNPNASDIFPQINAKGYIVWMKKEGSMNEIYYYDGSNTINISKNPNGEDWGPQINDNGDVVWQGRVSESEDRAIYYYKRSTKTKTPISENSDGNPDGDDEVPQINNKGHVVWHGIRGSETDIFYYNGSNIRILSENPDKLVGDHIYPKINSPGSIVWVGRNKLEHYVYHYNDSEVTALVDHPVQYLPFGISASIHDSGHFVWTGYRQSRHDTYYFDGSTTSTIADILGDNYNFYCVDPNINAEGDMVCWANTEPGYAIYFYDRATNRIGRVDFEADVGVGPTDDYFKPLINDDGIIVWSKFDGNDWEIYRCEP